MSQIDLKPEIAKKLDSYLDMLLAWNKSFNLVGTGDRKRVMSELVADSFYLADFLKTVFPEGLMDNELILEPGAGAGLPAIPLRLVWRQGFYVMAECRQKRAIFLANALARLNLPKTCVFRGRVEDFFGNAPLDWHNGKKAKCVISRAFLPWERLSPLCATLLEPDGKLVVLAGRGAPPATEDWLPAASLAYECAGKERWFHALAPVKDKKIMDNA